MKPILTQPTWDEIHRDTLMLIVKMQQEAHTFDSIIALSRGGLVPGLILSHALNTTMYPIRYSSSLGRGDDKNENDDILSLPVEGEKVLVVDDICDSGWTMKEVEELLTDRCREVQTVSLYAKLTSAHWPDAHIHTLPAGPDSPWIIFPWETSE